MGAEKQGVLKNCRASATDQSVQVSLRLQRLRRRDLATGCQLDLQVQANWLAEDSLLYQVQAKMSSWQAGRVKYSLVLPGHRPHCGS